MHPVRQEYKAMLVLQARMAKLVLLDYQACQVAMGFPVAQENVGIEE